MKELFRKPYVFWVVGIFIFYLILNIILSGFYYTIPLIVIYAKSVDWVKLGISLGLTLMIGVLVAMTSVLAFMRYKQRKECKKESAVAGVGAIGGLVVGVCPLCITGLLPLILSFIGISFSFASLPFQGIEIQVLVVLVLLGSLWMLKE